MIQRGVLVALVQTALLIVFYVSSSHLYWYVNNLVDVRYMGDGMIIVEQIGSGFTLMLLGCMRTRSVSRAFRRPVIHWR